MSGPAAQEAMLAAQNPDVTGHPPSATRIMCCPGSTAD
jgi:hypothetical protein